MTSSHSMSRCDALNRGEEDEREHVDAERDPAATDSGERDQDRIEGEPAKRRATLDDRRQHQAHGVDEEEEEEDPDQEEQREVLRLVLRPQEVGEHEPEHAEVRERLDERPDVAERGIGVPGLEVDDAHDAQHAEVVRDASRRPPTGTLRGLDHGRTSG